MGDLVGFVIHKSLNFFYSLGDHVVSSFIFTIDITLLICNMMLLNYLVFFPISFIHLISYDIMSSMPYFEVSMVEVITTHCHILRIYGD